MFPEVRKAFVSGVTGTWVTDPYSRGETSYAVVDGVPGRQFLADTPIDNRVFVAGQALAVLPHSSLPGAYQAGRAAATRVLTVI